MREIEHRWRHVEHLLLTCPCVTSPRGDMAVTILRRDLCAAAADDAPARRVVELAFPSAAPEPAVAAVYSVPFLLDPVRALRDAGGVRGDTVVECSRLVACYVLGVACHVCGESAAGVARDFLAAVRLPEYAEIGCLAMVQRSAGQDAVASGCSLVDGVCECDVSALRQGGAEADALSGMA